MTPTAGKLDMMRTVGSVHVDAPVQNSRPANATTRANIEPVGHDLPSDGSIFFGSLSRSPALFRAGTTASELRSRWSAEMAAQTGQLLDQSATPPLIRGPVPRDLIDPSTSPMVAHFPGQDLNRFPDVAQGQGTGGLESLADAGLNLSRINASISRSWQSGEPRHTTHGSDLAVRRPEHSGLQKTRRRGSQLDRQSGLAHSTRAIAAVSVADDAQALAATATAQPSQASKNGYGKSLFASRGHQSAQSSGVGNGVHDHITPDRIDMSTSVGAVLLSPVSGYSEGGSAAAVSLFSGMSLGPLNSGSGRFTDVLRTGVSEMPIADRPAAAHIFSLAAAFAKTSQDLPQNTARSSQGASSISVVSRDSAEMSATSGVLAQVPNSDAGHGGNGVGAPVSDRPFAFSGSRTAEEHATAPVSVDSPAVPRLPAAQRANRPEIIARNADQGVLESGQQLQMTERRAEPSSSEGKSANSLSNGSGDRFMTRLTTSSMTSSTANAIDSTMSSSIQGRLSELKTARLGSVSTRTIAPSQSQTASDLKPSIEIGTPVPTPAQHGAMPAFALSGRGDTQVVSASPFQAMDAVREVEDSGATHSMATGSQRLAILEMGYQDPTLGYVELHAHMTAGGVHASLAAQSPESEKMLEGHLDSLAGWMNERQTPVESLTVLSSLPGRQQEVGRHDGTTSMDWGSSESRHGSEMYLGGGRGGRSGGDEGPGDADVGSRRVPVSSVAGANQAAALSAVESQTAERRALDVIGASRSSPVMVNERTTGSNISVLA